MGFSVGVKLGSGVGVLNLGVGVAKVRSGVSVGVGNGVGVFVGMTKYTVGTGVSSRFAAAVAVRLAGVMYPLLQTMVSAAVIHRRKISLMRLCVGMFLSLDGVLRVTTSITRLYFLVSSEEIAIVWDAVPS